jgi:penicillin-binding protein 1C
VWVGNADGDAMHEVSGTSGAAPVWQAVVRALHASSPSRRAAPPPGVVALHTAFDMAAAWEPLRPEFYLSGTEWPQRRGTPVVPAVGTSERFGITHPRDGSVFALDPDIPPAVQRIRFEGEDGRWLLDGKRLGRGEHWLWSPQPGKHQLKLLAPDGRSELGVVNFEVRGAALKTASAGR